MTISDTFLGGSSEDRPAYFASADLRVTAIRDVACFAALRAEWDRLACAVPGRPYAAHAYLEAWFESFGAGCRPEIRVLRRDRRLVGALALCRGQTVGARLPAAHGRMGIFAPILDPSLAQPDAALAMLFHCGYGRYHVLEPMERESARQLVASARAAGLRAQISQVFTANSADVGGGAEAWRASLSKNARRALTRGARALETEGARWVTSAEGQGVAAEAFLRACVMSWKTDAGTGYAGSPAGRAFIRALARKADPSTLYFATLFHGDTPVGGSFSSVDGDTLYLNSIEFNELMAALGPGRFLMGRVIEAAADMGLARVDLMRTSPMNQSLAKDARPLYRVTLHRRGDLTVHLRRVAGLKRRIARVGRAALSPRARHQAKRECRDEA